ncbi:MAG TPA: class I SAM-dependent methyltransferase [Nitrolancea sp.]|jgi:SAM-dependent methyltransferase|nr:class I SAM-dependent methyltransferase [Nitrolancea sp.]
MSSDIATLYSQRYEQPTNHLYPVEFVVRAFLGTYPGLTMDRSVYAGSRIVDLGYGDGRNMPLLRNLGFEIFGVEIHEDITRSTQTRLEKAGVSATLAVGSNASIPFPDNFFQYALACHAFYYVADGTSFTHNSQELHRAMAPGGTFIVSLPMTGGYLVKTAESLGDGHVRLTRDPCGVRVGTIFRVFDSAGEIERTLSPWFRDFQIGFTDDDYWGLRQRMWIVVCTRR